MGTIAIVLLAVGIFLSFFPHEGNGELIVRNVDYVVEKNEYGGLVAAKFGMDWRYIAETNGLNPDSRLRVGQVLKIRFSRIVPTMHDDGIIINIPDRTLYRFSKGKLKDYYFIAAGKATWQTPIGKFTKKERRRIPLGMSHCLSEERWRRRAKRCLQKCRPDLTIPWENTGSGYP